MLSNRIRNGKSALRIHCRFTFYMNAYLDMDRCQEPRVDHTHLNRHNISTANIRLWHELNLWPERALTLNAHIQQSIDQTISCKYTSIEHVPRTMRSSSTKRQSNFDRIFSRGHSGCWRDNGWVWNTHSSIPRTAMIWLYFARPYTAMRVCITHMRLETSAMAVKKANKISGQLEENHHINVFRRTAHIFRTLERKRWEDWDWEKEEKKNEFSAEPFNRRTEHTWTEFDVVTREPHSSQPVYECAHTVSNAISAVMSHERIKWQGNKLKLN